MSDSSLPTADGPVRPRPRGDKSARFLPGMVVAGRYRVVAPLGRGGMGEVYRADDMKLGQAVALKFLPLYLSGDPVRRERLLEEVRLARQVAHPNVCRVWDVGEVDAHDFLAMEYVDGEDLSSLLRRIGRLPEDRAVRMSRELCAGLAAVHDEGILHRDLKPANVLVDGRGRVKLADFGLASLAADEGADLRSGTPAYMSPEQLEGREVSVRSDVYALGLVLYELFTGHTAYPAKTMEEAAHRNETPLSSPSSHVQGLDPAIERAIERCLETDPSLRPASASAVAASLPGGDPLAAALAAGETPSPELVAAAGGTGGLKLPVAVAVAAAIGLGLTAVAWVGDRAMPYLADLEKPTAVLAHEARQILQEHGAPPDPADQAHGFVVEEGGDGSSRLVFWYRESPRSLTQGVSLTDPGISFSNPAPIVPGMAGVRLDAQGRLVELLRVPGFRDPDGQAPGWPALLARTGVASEVWDATEPRTIPPVFADARQAWEAGTDHTDSAAHAEGASFEGWPVHLLVQPRHEVGRERGDSGTFQGFYLLLAILALAAIVARRNLRLGRVDHAGARRVAAIGFFVSGVGFLLLGNPRVLDPVQLLLGVMISTFFIMVFWLTYVALEPVVRRRWPDTLASWTRLLSGRLSDPLLGRDLLLGVLGGVALALLELAGRALTELSSVQFSVPPELLLGGWAAAGGVVRSISSVLPAFILLLLLAVLRQLLRATWAAVLGTLVIGGLLLGDFTSLSGVVVSLAFVALTIGILIRLGLLASAVALTVHHLLAHSFMTTHLTAWYADSAVAGILVTLALAGWGVYTSALRFRGSGPPAR